MEAIKTDTMMEQKLEQGGAMMVETAKGLKITTHEDYDRGTTILKDIKTRVKAVKEYWKGPKEAANAADNVRQPAVIPVKYDAEHTEQE